MKQKIVRAIALSLAITGAGFIFAKENLKPVSENVAVVSKTEDSVKGKMSATKRENSKVAAPLALITQPVKPASRQEEARSEGRDESVRGALQDVADAYNEGEAQTSEETPASRSPEQYQMGKAELNLGYVLEKDSAFLDGNPELKQKIASGQQVNPEEIYFPPGFRLSLRFQPSCLDLANQAFELGELDENGKSLVEDGHPVYVSARLKEGLRGNELMNSLEREQCVGSAGADLREELSQVSYYNEPYIGSSSSTATGILRNAGLTDLFNTMSYSDFGTVTVRIGVVDSGIELSHPDLRSIVSGSDDDRGHGSKVMGTAAAPDNGIGTVGAMPFHARGVGYKVNIPGSGSAYTSSINNGITRAAYDGMDVINVSWSGFTKGSYNSAINTAIGRGAFVTGAAGNSGAYVSRNVTASGSMAVGALAATTSAMASYSNYGPGVEIYTPGTYMTTNHLDGYGLSSGTSFAAPLVGGIGLMAKAYAKARGKTISPATIESIIRETSVRISTSRGTVSKMKPLSVYNKLKSMYGSGGTGGSTPSPSPTPTSPWDAWN